MERQRSRGHFLEAVFATAIALYVVELVVLLSGAGGTGVSYLTSLLGPESRHPIAILVSLVVLFAPPYFAVRLVHLLGFRFAPPTTLLPTKEYNRKMTWLLGFLYGTITIVVVAFNVFPQLPTFLLQAVAAVMLTLFVYFLLRLGSQNEAWKENQA